MRDPRARRRAHPCTAENAPTATPNHSISPSARSRHPVYPDPLALGGVEIPIRYPLSGEYQQFVNTFGVAAWPSLSKS
jgi:hypothetical protein